jgi:hypothetical protein
MSALFLGDEIENVRKEEYSTYKNTIKLNINRI